MGLIDFVQNAGKQLGLIRDEPEAAPAAASGGGAAPTVSAEELERLRARKLGAAIVEEIQTNGLEVENLSVRVEGDTVIVKGSVDTQEIREKVVLLAGNTQGIARVDDQLEVEADEPAATLYTVESGDTLSAIAEQHYGDAGKYMLIFEANQPMLEDPNKIYPGQVLRIPPEA